MPNPTTEPTCRVPEAVTHKEFIAAIKPLLGLLGVTEDEVYSDLHITSCQEPGYAVQVTMLLVPRTEGDDSPVPQGIASVQPAQSAGELAERTITLVRY